MGFVEDIWTSSRSRPVPPGGCAKCNMYQVMLTAKTSRPDVAESLRLVGQSRCLVCPPRCPRLRLNVERTRAAPRAGMRVESGQDEWDHVAAPRAGSRDRATPGVGVSPSVPSEGDAVQLVLSY